MNHTQPFHYIISIIFKSNENLDNNTRKNPQKYPFIGVQKPVGYYDASHKMIPTIFNESLLYHSYKTCKKKWHRSVKMDKNKCPFFKSAREILQTPPFKKPIVSIMLRISGCPCKMWLHTFLIYICPKTI